MELIYHHFARFGLEMHIGQGASKSKTKCIFFPPPQFFQQSKREETAAKTIQQVFPGTTTTHKAVHIVTQPTPNPHCPTNFPVGC